jgi:hypothetical protein
MPAANSTGSTRIAYHGRENAVAPPASTSRDTSVAVSNPSPNSRSTGYMCHGLVTPRSTRPSSRARKPRLIGVGISALAGPVTDDASQLQQATGLIGTLVSGVFLVLIGLLNLVSLVGIARVFRRMRTGELDEAGLERQLDNLFPLRPASASCCRSRRCGPRRTRAAHRAGTPSHRADEVEEHHDRGHARDRGAIGPVPARDPAERRSDSNGEQYSPDTGCCLLLAVVISVTGAR